ncbi:DUF443 family protein [Virgibacillus kimchii]
MNCKVNGVKKNLRYRILTINDQTYILDMGRSFWKTLFPLSYWIFPNTAYKVNDHEIIKKMKSPEVEQNKTGGDSVLAGFLAVVLANLIGPVAGYFDVPSTPLVNSIILLLVILLILFAFFYINNRSKKSLFSIVNLKQFPMKRLWIRPQSYKNFFFILFFYLLLLGSIILLWGGFIQLANAMILFTGMILMIITLLISALTVPVGQTSVKFKDDKKADV